MKTNCKQKTRRKSVIEYLPVACQDRNVNIVIISMETRFGDQGYLATELQPSSEITNHEFESFYNFPGCDNKKLTQLTSPSPRYCQEPSTMFRSDPRHSTDIRAFTTSVSVEESDFLDEFMSHDYPAGSRDRSAHGSLQDLSFCGSLTELDNLPRHPDSASTSVSSSATCPTSNTPTQSYKFSTLSYHQEQENRFPGNGRSNSGFGNAHSVGNKSLKAIKNRGGNTNDSTGVSLLRQQLQGSLCSSKYRKAQETLCKECNKPFTAKCLLKVCRKSDEVLCPDCGQELTAKCLLKSCSPDRK